MIRRLAIPLLASVALLAAEPSLLGGPGEAGPVIPPGAAALGYTVKAVDEHPTAADIAPNNANNGNYKWFNGAWWDGKRPPMSHYSTTNGVLTIRYDADTDTGGCLIGTPRDLSKGVLPWLDGAKGFYIEFDTRLSDNDPNHWPAVWVMPVEHSGGSGKPLRDVYPGDPDGFERWMELDVDEGGLAKSGGAMCSAISWWGRWSLGGFKSDISNNWATGEALDRTKVHTFGASYDPVKRQVTSWVDGKKKWQTPVDCSSVPEIAPEQHFYPILSVWRVDKGVHEPYSMYVSGVRAYIPPHAPLPAKSGGIAKADTATARYGWCVVNYPKTCSPGKEFEVTLAISDPEKVTKSWKANKLAVHLFWSTGSKWGGYLAHFASAEVGKDSSLVLRGKFQLDAKTAEAACVKVQGYLTDDWADDKHRAAEFFGPVIELVK